MRQLDRARQTRPIAGFRSAASRVERNQDASFRAGRLEYRFVTRVRFPVTAPAHIVAAGF
jgi:hypothetical protein